MAEHDKNECSVGSLLGKGYECHKFTFVRSVSLTEFRTLTEEDQVKVMYRARLFKQRDNIISICGHHKAFYIDCYESLQAFCCDPLEVHSKKINKRLQSVSLEYAEKPQLQHLNLIPGKKVCGNCRTRLTKICQDSVVPELPTIRAACAEQVSTSSNEVPSALSKFGGNSRGICRGDEMSTDSEGSSSLYQVELSSSFQGMTESPLKFKNLKKSSRKSYVKRKLSRVHAKMTKKAAVVLNLPVEELEQCNDDSDQECRTIEQKAEDLDLLMLKIKDKMMSCTTSAEKTQLLTLVPESWTRKAVTEFFDVTDYQARAASALVKSDGILTMPPPRKGKTLSSKIKNTIIEFYCSEENSRIMPGNKDKVSISRNMYEQKRLILSTLKELYLSFKQNHPDLQVGFSSFASLRPKWCVLAGSAGTHSVCVCTIHQNVILMIKAGRFEENYHDLIGMMVCDPNNKGCMLQRCSNCPGPDIVAEYLQQKFENEEENITFSQWVATDRTELVYKILPINEYLDVLMTKLAALLPHSYIAKQQAEFLKREKETMQEGTVLILMDFSENYTFHVQDEAQGYHWTHKNCTVHPVVCYFKLNETLQHQSLCFLSSDLCHDVGMVYEIQKRTVQFLKTKIVSLKKIEYFTDGCAAQYKNYKNFFNLCKHEEDFGVSADWSFYATSHGKSACDGIGGTVKRSTALESLRRKAGDPQIISVNEMIRHCEKAIPSILFQEIEVMILQKTREELQVRYSMANTIKGTRSFHNFVPLSSTKIAMKRINFDEDYALVIDFQQPQHRAHAPDFDIKQGRFLAAVYDKCWYIGHVAEADSENREAKVHFLHPNGPAVSFHYPKYEDVCWVPYDHVLCCIEAPILATLRGQYTLPEKTVKKITNAWKIFST